MSGVSILIPARNESQTIGRTLLSIIAQIPAEWSAEVIVCDNGSTDATVEEVMRAARKDSRVRLIRESRAGKTHAWNRLYQEAKYDIAVFTDADILLGPAVLPQLVAALEEGPRWILVGARSVPYRKSLSAWHRFVAAVTQPDREQTWIVGRTYALRCAAFSRRMKELGLARMPEILAAEDTWVSLVAGREHWQVESDAIVYHMPYTLSEFARIERRHLMSLDQLSRECPQLVEQGRLHGQGRNLVRQKLTECLRAEGLISKVCCLLRLPIVGLVRYPVQRALRRGKAAPFKWEVSRASKNLPEHVS